MTLEKEGNSMHRLYDNVSNKCAEITDEIEKFTDSKLRELREFIDSHNDCYFDEEHVCPTCGHKLQFGEEFVNDK